MNLQRLRNENLNCFNEPRNVGAALGEIIKCVHPHGGLSIVDLKILNFIGLLYELASLLSEFGGSNVNKNGGG